VEGEVSSDLAQQRARYYEAGFYGQTTLADEMRAGAAAHPNVRMVFHSSTHPAQATLREMHARSLALAGSLHSLGLQPGDVVAIQVPNWLEGALAFQASMILGVVVLPIIHIYGPAEVGFILRQSGARAFICPDRWRHIDYLERLERLDRSSLPQLEHVIVIGDRTPEGAISWSDFENRARPELELPRVAPDDVCLLVYTSGTTAEPKGVQHTHNTLLAEVRGIRTTQDTPRTVASLSAFPAGHIAGVLGLTRLYVHGGRTVLMDNWDAGEAARLIEAHGVTSTAGTPFHLAGLLDSAEASGCDLSSLTGYLTGAASVPPSLIERAQAAGIPTYRSYGSSEHPTVSSGSATDPLEKRSGTDGRVLPGNEVRVVDDDGKPLPLGQAGEIATRGPELFVGYRDEALNEEAFAAEGWFLTGDIGVLDEDGFLRITDRKKDVIIRGGENIASKEVEDVLSRHPAVQEAAVIAMPDERYGERVCAYVILREGASLELPQVVRHFETEGLAKQKTPEHLVRVADFPRTAAGKVKKFELREQLREASRRST
jgi:acyl-CoA synthetase (AMP-forming)/AMP-acid ligase II